jgi:hypothetical protein
MAFTIADNEPLWGLILTDPDRPADHVDQVVSGLLDIQDDIAKTVMWIAQHWSTDLPPITWSTGGVPEDDTTTVLVVTARCSTVEDLERVARLLRSRVLVEPLGDLRLVHHAWRSFGQVLFRATHTEPTLPIMGAA